MAAVAHNLPAEHMPPIGRDGEAAAVRVFLLNPATPLVTLVGPGGMGKTTLALHLAHDTMSHFPDGVHFIDLTPLAQPDFIPGQIARAVGIEEAAGLSLEESLIDHYHDRRALLLLDNFEHLLPGAATVGALLRACPSLHVLATSREALRLRQEQIFPLSPLALPPAGEARDPTDLSAVAAVELFVRRAQAVQPGFALTVENAAAVAAIVARLDGLPLAIELAAARVRLFPPKVLLARLEASPLGVLTGGARDVPARQQTVRATMAWSYGLLTPVEQAIFRRLGVFAGGFTSPAVAAVAAPFADAGDVGEPLLSLLDKNLLTRAPGDELRFGLLETLRAFALEQLEAAEEGETARRAHYDHYLTLAEAAWPHLRGPAADDWLAQLVVEEDNLRAALGWSLAEPPLAAGEFASGIRLTGALGDFWMFAGRQREGRIWTDRALTRLDAAPAAGAAERAADSARLLTAAGSMAWLHSDFPASAALHRRAMDAYRQAADERGELMARHDLTMQLTALGHYDESLALAAENVERFARLNDWDGVATSHTSLGLTYMRAGDPAAARDHFEQALEYAGRAGHEFLVTANLNNLGQAEIQLGNLTRAAEYLNASLAGAARQRQTVAEIDPTIAFGRLREALGDTGAALHDDRRALRLAHEANMRLYVADALEQIAFALHGLGQAERAARLLGAAAALRERMGTADEREHVTYYNERLPRVRAALGEQSFAAAWEMGRLLSRDEAVALALAVTSDERRLLSSGEMTGEEATDDQKAKGAAADPLAALTPREREVALLMARGRTNEQIAAELFITLKTVEKHAGNALGKLGLRNRVELAAWLAQGQ